MVDTSKLTGAQRNRFWRCHVRDWRLSGLNQNAYCREQDLNVGVFRYWVGKVPVKEVVKDPPGTGRLRFVPIAAAGAVPQEPSSETATQEIEIKFSDCVIVVKGAVHEANLAAVIRALRSSRCGRERKGSSVPLSGRDRYEEIK